MPKCPRCGNKCDEDFLKERGLCSECGYSIRQTSSSRAAIDQYNSSIRKKNDSLKKSSSQSKLTKVNAKELKKDTGEKQKKCVQQSADQQRHINQPTHKEEICQEKIRPAQSDVQSILVETTQDQYADPIFQTEQAEPQIGVSENIIESTPEAINLNDPIFLNADGPLSFEVEEDNDDDIDEDTTVHDKHDYESNTIDERITQNTSAFLLPFFYLKTWREKRKSLRREQFEADVDYDFNYDGFYNDTVPASPYEMDAISRKTIFKAFAAVVGVFAFIAFIIYYA